MVAEIKQTRIKEMKIELAPLLSIRDLHVWYELRQIGRASCRERV